MELEDETDRTVPVGGKLLIVFGHVIGDPQNPYNLVTQPAYTKQVGVALFVFITGWGLANNKQSYNYQLPPACLPRTALLAALSPLVISIT